MGKLLVFSGPSGVGKSTIVKFLLENFTRLRLSISATTRQPRGGEVEGRDYYFLSLEEFTKKIDTDDFIEWEQVYKGKYYGTLKSEVERIHGLGNVPVFDIDYKGAKNIKNVYGDKVLLIFVRPPSIDVLKERLIKRGSETDESLKERIDKFEIELSREGDFDLTLVNDVLEDAKQKALQITHNFIAGPSLFP